MNERGNDMDKLFGIADLKNKYYEGFLRENGWENKWDIDVPGDMALDGFLDFIEDEWNREHPNPITDANAVGEGFLEYQKKLGSIPG